MPKEITASIRREMDAFFLGVLPEEPAAEKETPYVILERSKRDRKLMEELKTLREAGEELRRRKEAGEEINGIFYVPDSGDGQDPHYLIYKREQEIRELLRGSTLV